MSKTVERYRSWVGPHGFFDVVASGQFNLLTLCGLRQHHTLLDIGCGSLRGGRLFLAYLEPGNYYGIEPETWVLEEGISKQLGQEFIAQRRPTFSADRDFTLTVFGRTFDYLLAQSIFSHTSLPQLRRCLEQAREVMHPGSVFFATFVRGRNDYTGDEWVYPGRVKFRTETVRRVAEESGLEMLLLDWPHPRQQWVAFFPAGSEPPKVPASEKAHAKQVKALQRRINVLDRQRQKAERKRQKAERKRQKAERKRQKAQARARSAARRLERLRQRPLVRLDAALRKAGRGRRRRLRHQRDSGRG